MVKGKIRVFVYGTLKFGHPLHPILESGKDVQFIDRDYLKSNLMMVSMGAFPALVEDGYNPDSEYKVFGEVYSVDAETLAALDYAEGHPIFYKRRKMRTQEGDFNAWVYVLQEDAAEYTDEWLKDGVWNPSHKEEQYVSKVGA